MNIKKRSTSFILQVFASFAFAVVTGVFIVEKALAQTACSRIFDAGSLPALYELRQFLPAIHLTNFLPKHGRLNAYADKRARFMPTLHFTLGEPVIDHSHGKWSDSKYAFVMPVKVLESQILNVFPQDTFVLGHVNLTEDVRLFIPRGEDPGDVGPVEIVYYDPQIPIKEVVQNYLEQNKFIKLNATGSKPENKITYKDEDVTGLKFWEEISKNPPTYELHSKTVWGLLDRKVYEDFYFLFQKGAVQVTPTVESLRNDIETLNSLLKKADAKYQGMKDLPLSAHEGYMQARSRLKNLFIRILEVELDLQLQHGKTIMGWQEGHIDKILPAIESETTFINFVKTHFSEIPTIKQTEKTTAMNALLSEGANFAKLFKGFRNEGILRGSFSMRDFNKSIEQYKNLFGRLEEMSSDLKDVYLSAATENKRTLVLESKIFIKFLELEMSLRLEHRKSMAIWTEGHQKVLAAMTSEIALELFVKNHISEFPIFD